MGSSVDDLRPIVPSTPNGTMTMEQAHVQLGIRARRLGVGVLASCGCVGAHHTRVRQLRPSGGVDATQIRSGALVTLAGPPCGDVAHLDFVCISLVFGIIHQ